MAGTHFEWNRYQRHPDFRDDSVFTNETGSPPIHLQQGTNTVKYGLRIPADTPQGGYIITLDFLTYLPTGAESSSLTYELTVTSARVTRDHLAFNSVPRTIPPMTPDHYRLVALSFPGAAEGSHMDHPDFRVGGKIFATLWKGDGVLMLNLDQQARISKANPGVFAPANGAWGRRGATTVRLALANERVVRRAMTLAYQNKAPKDVEG